MVMGNVSAQLRYVQPIDRHAGGLAEGCHEPRPPKPTLYKHHDVSSDVAQPAGHFLRRGAPFEHITDQSSSALL